MKSARRMRGGREARKQARAGDAGSTPSPAIWSGIKGGNYRPLTGTDIEKIHATALRILEEIGLTSATPRCIDVVTRAGGVLTDDGRLLFPATLVEKTLSTAARGFTLYAQDPTHDIDPSTTRVHLGTSGAAVHVIDTKTRQVRDSTLRDLYDMARLADALPNIHMFQRTVVARDIHDPREMDLNTTYACIKGTAKHVGTSFSNATHLEEAVQMLHMVAGGEMAFRNRPFLCVSTCFVVPPLKFAEEALGVIECAADHGVPLKVADLRTGAMSGGSAEQGLLMAACAQMAQYYDIPCAVSAGMTDSKLPDFQAGYEKGYTELLSALAGANLIYEAAGMYGSLLACSLESFVLDNDLIGAVLRATRGIEVNEDSLSFDTIRDVCLGGPGHFLGHSQTLNRMQSDYFYPALADRRTPQQWRDEGAPDILEHARLRTQAILSGSPPAHIPPAIDREIRARFPIHL